jgi:hypothetical protein
MQISGEDDAGNGWDGDVDLEVDDDGSVTGTIAWESTNGLSGTETVEGTLDDDGTLEMWGTSVDSDDIVTCRYEGTWVGDSFDVDWVGHCPSGHAGTDEDDEDDEGEGTDG